MPKVGKKEYPYTAKGMAMAKAEAKKSGKKMVRLVMQRTLQKERCQQPIGQIR